jgi:hypothetical protein
VLTLTTTPRRALRGLVALGALALLTVSATTARAIEPWSDPDPPGEGRRWALNDFGFRAGAEYRGQFTYVNPIALNSETTRRVSWIEHRLRLETSIDYKDKIKIVASADLLDGVVWGDNGDFGGDPSSISGSNVNTRNPNVTRPCVGLVGSDPLDAEAYGYSLCTGNQVSFRKLYGEVVTPIGVLRVGRMPVNIGTGVQAADGEGRPNRFGISRTGGLVDRVLFATKPLEAFKAPGNRDTSANKGLILAFAYDRWATDSPQLLGDDVNQWDTALRFMAPRYPLGQDLLLSAYHAHRWDAQYGTKIESLGFRVASRFGPIHAGMDMAVNLGKTREINEAYKLITNDPPTDQTVRQIGLRAVVRYDHRLFTAYLEADYASGDDDPTARTPLTQFTFSEDTNVGLLLFKHIVGFQSARSSAAAVELLRRLGATSYPAEAVNTRGAFTNAFAIFPQVDVRPHRTVLLRGGVLAAWAPAKLIDPVASLQRRDGLTVKDDLVNFVGGTPGSFYGVELDARAQWRFMDHFALDIEGALLFPGDALRDEDGYAVRSGMVQTRTTFFF